MIFGVRHSGRGCPIPFGSAQGGLLLFLQVCAAMLYALPDWLRRNMDQQSCVCIHDPVLRRERERRGIHLIADAGELCTFIVIPNLSRCLTTF
jgi:hypothetical protein